jgi:proline iminopeptidase
MTDLYPEQQPYESGYYDVGGGHLLAFNRYGNPSGKPVVYLHGGPGAGTSWEYKLFHPDHYNILLFDQRGAGASTPYAEIKNNSIEDLVTDIEKLRVETNVEQWSIAGGSWGSALGMFYAAKYPKRVSRMLLRGIFFADSIGAKHIIEADGAAARHRNLVFDAYEKFIPENERRNGLMLPYYNRLMLGNAEGAVEAAWLFDRWDTSIASIEPKPEWLADIDANPMASLALSRLFFYYSVHYFHEQNHPYLLNAMKQLDVPVAIIHGRQDHICPVENAAELHAVCKNSSLDIIENCGHTMAELGLRKAFLSITDGWMRSDDTRSCDLFEKRAPSL